MLLNRPQALNALATKLWEELSAAIDVAVRYRSLRSTRSAFSAISGVSAATNATRSPTKRTFSACNGCWNTR